MDRSTLHLWPLDESSVSVVDAVSGGTSLIGLINGATLGNASYSGFGSALNTGEAGAAIITATNKNAILTAKGLG